MIEPTYPPLPDGLLGVPAYKRGVTFMGIPVYVCDYLPVATTKVRRTWKERLFSWPWRPWVAYKEVPTSSVYLLKGTPTAWGGDALLMRPEDIAAVIRNVALPGETYRPDPKGKRL